MSDDNQLKIQLTRKQSEFDYAIERAENVLYGGAKGGGKSHGLRLIMIKRRIEHPHSKGVIFRKTYPELYNNHISPIFKQFPMLKPYYNQGTKEITFPNGSILAFRHCQYERDLSLHQGVEYNDLAIEEAGEWPENWFWTLKGSNRSSTPGIKPRCLLTGNPGGVGHKWLKRLFIERNFRSMENPQDFIFIPSRVYDNPFLMENDPKYIDRLRSNKSEQLVKAYLEGSWDIQAGQFFDQLNRDIHVIRPFTIPDHWARMGMLDTGFNHPAYFGWLASDEDGNAYLYREYCKAKRRTEELVQDIMEFKDTTQIRSIPAGHDCWVKHDGGPSVEEKFSEASKHKLVLHKAVIARVAGAQQVRDYLALRPTGKMIEGTDIPEKKPRLFIFNTCPITFDCLTRMVHDDDNVEDVLKVDAEEGDPYTGDDAYDGLRYGLMDRPQISIAPRPPQKHRYHKDDVKRPTAWTV